MKQKAPSAKFHGTGPAAREAASRRAIEINGVAYEVDISGPWDGFWSGPDYPHNAPHDPILDARDPGSVG